MAVDSRVSVVSSSDQAYTYECTLCKEEGESREGVAFCTNCRDYLCRRCLKAHTRIRSSKDHILLQGSDIEQAVKDTGVSGYERCVRHTNNFVDFFCLTHSEVICSVCQYMDHKSCIDVKRIDCLCRGIYESKQAETFLDGAESLVAKLRRAQRDRTEELGQLELQKKVCIENVKALRQELDSMLDKLESEMHIAIKQATSAESTAIENQLLAVNGAIISLERDAAILRDACSTAKDRQIFIQIQRMDLERTGQLYQLLTKDQPRVKLAFEADAMVKSLLSGSLKNLGRLTMDTATNGTQKSPPFCGQVLPSILRGLEPVKTGEHDIRVQDDACTCLTTGSQFLQDGRLLLCDFSSNKNLKLFDDNFQLLNYIRISDHPFDVALVSQQEVVVTVPWKQRLQFVSVSGQLLMEGRTLATEKRCWGIAVHNKSLFVSCHNSCDDGEVLVMDMLGRCQRRVGVNQDGSFQFRNPFYVAVDLLGRLYVSDNGTHTVTCTSLDGSIIYTFKDRLLDWLKNPRQLLVDEDRNVYVCGGTSDTVLVISASGRNSKTLLTSSAGLRDPRTLAFRESDRTLVVGMWGQKAIMSYKFQ